MAGWFATGLGVVAGCCSTASFAPQALKIWRERDTHAISRRMYMITVTAFALWIAYGVAIASLPIIIFNALSLLLSGSILFLKVRNQMNGEDDGGAPASSAPQR